MTPTIPNEAVEAAALALANYDCRQFDCPELTTIDDFRLETDSLSYFEHARAALTAAAPMMVRHQPIATAPTDGTKFDAWTRHGERIPNVWWERGAWRHWWADGFGSMGVVKVTDALTHWMPLPSVPRDAGLAEVEG